MTRAGCLKHLTGGQVECSPSVSAALAYGVAGSPDACGADKDAGRSRIGDGGRLPICRSKRSIK